ncbi:hypothetical protein HOY82DRAFT_619832 [Tuber indicum]|nr:hypothetical protein HOY82DRAFT_619832 [Tuber indicum]
MSLSGPSHFQHRASDDSDSSMGTSSDSSASRSTVPSSLPSLEQHESKTASPAESEIFDYHPAHDPRESENTYCSTVEDPDDDYPYYDTHPYVHYHKAPPPPQASPSTPSEFAELFPSTRCLSIRHDDSTLDGNMNLRVDTNVAAVGDVGKNVTLFHLRMYDLRTRDFSLRRYGRDCGREVAHIKRKTIKPAPQRPILQRSVNLRSGTKSIRQLLRELLGFKDATSLAWAVRNGTFSYKVETVIKSHELLEALPRKPMGSEECCKYHMGYAVVAGIMTNTTRKVIDSGAYAKATTFQELILLTTEETIGANIVRLENSATGPMTLRIG